MLELNKLPTSSITLILELFDRRDCSIIVVNNRNDFSCVCSPFRWMLEKSTLDLELWCFRPFHDTWKCMWMHNEAG